MQLLSRRIRLQDKIIPLPRFIRAPLNLDEFSTCYATVLQGGSLQTSLYHSNVNELFVSPFEPNLWGDLWHLNLTLIDRPGLIKSLISLLNDQKIEVLGHEGSATHRLRNHLSFIISCANYSSINDGRSTDRIFSKKVSLGDLQDLIVSCFITDFDWDMMDVPKISLRRLGEHNATFRRLRIAGLSNPTTLEHQSESFRYGYRSPVKNSVFSDSSEFTWDGKVLEPPRRCYIVNMPIQNSTDTKKDSQAPTDGAPDQNPTDKNEATQVESAPTDGAPDQNPTDKNEATQAESAPNDSATDGDSTHKDEVSPYPIAKGLFLGQRLYSRLTSLGKGGNAPSEHSPSEPNGDDNTSTFLEAMPVVDTYERILRIYVGRNKTSNLYYYQIVFETRLRKDLYEPLFRLFKFGHLNVVKSQTRRGISPELYKYMMAQCKKYNPNKRSEDADEKIRIIDDLLLKYKNRDGWAAAHEIAQILSQFERIDITFEVNESWLDTSFENHVHYNNFNFGEARDRYVNSIKGKISKIFPGQLACLDQEDLRTEVYQHLDARERRDHDSKGE